LGDQRLARRMGDNARQLVLQRFTWAKVAERCLDAYAELSIRDRRPPGRLTAR
jgi:hypothetical protein